MITDGAQLLSAWETEVWVADAPDHLIHFKMVSGSSGRMEPTNSCMPSTRVARSGNRRR